MNDPEYEVAEGEDRDSGDKAFLNDAEDEVVAATPEVELLNDVTQHCLNEIGAKPLFTPKEEYHWACLAQNSDFEARQKMIEHNLRLVVNIAKHYLNRGIVTWWICQSIERSIMNHSRTIRLPVNVVNEITIILRAIRHMELANGRETSLDHIARAIADENAVDPDTLSQSREIGGLVGEWVLRLPEKQRKVLERRYGLNGAEIGALEEIAADLELTRERMRQIQIEAIDQLRRAIKRGGISRENLL